MKLSNPYPQKLLLSSLTRLAAKYAYEDIATLDVTRLEAELAELDALTLQQTLSPHQRDFGVVVCDLRGFTALTERHAPLQVVQLLNHFYQVMVGVIDAHGGVIDKFMGDSVLALFDSKDAPDTAERMLACMLSMQLAMDEVNAWAHSRQLPDLYMGIGASYGSATLCELGSAVYRELTVLGDTVNLAARITAYCLRGQILVSAPLYEMIRETVLVGNSHDVHFKGKHESTLVYEVLGRLLPEPLLLPVREQRRGYRVDVNLGLGYQLVTGKELDRSPTLVRTVNLSRSGLTMRTPAPLAYADEVKLQLPFLPGADRSEVYARVVSCKQEDDGTYSPCVEFTYVDEDTAQALNIFVDRLVL